MVDQVAPVGVPTPTRAEEVLEIPEFAPATPPEPKVEEEKVIEPEAAPAEVAPVAIDEQAVLKKRLHGAITEVEKKNEEVKRVVELQAQLVGENPELIHRIVTSDPILGEKVIRKVWGSRGINSYKQLIEKAKLEQIKDSNPDLYETKSEMLQIKADLELRKQKDQESIKSEFLKSKGIQNNEYDPNFVKVQEALAFVNPTLVEQDYSTALAHAHAIAFAGTNQVVSNNAQPPVMASVGGGLKAAPLPSQNPGYSENTLWLDQALSKRNGYKPLTQ